MTWYIQYYTAPGVEALGDRGVIRVDGRLGILNVKLTAERNNGISRPIYHSYKLLRGDRLGNAKPVTEEIKL